MQVFISFFVPFFGNQQANADIFILRRPRTVVTLGVSATRKSISMRCERLQRWHRSEFCCKTVFNLLACVIFSCSQQTELVCVLLLVFLFDLLGFPLMKTLPWLTHRGVHTGSSPSSSDPQLLHFAKKHGSMTVAPLPPPLGRPCSRSERQTDSAA